MTEEEGKTLKILEARVIQIALSYKDLKAKCEELTQTLKAKDATINTLHQQINTLQTDYNNLRIAKTLTLTNNDTKDARETITHLVREVNKCIALLNA